MPISRFISGGAAGAVGAPAATSQTVSAGQTLSNVTFLAFTDPDGVIVSYSASISSAGSATVSGTGLGPWSINGAVDGDSGTLLLNALDSSGNVVGTAVHSWAITVEAGYSAWKALVATDATLFDDPNTLVTSFGVDGSGFNEFVGGTQATSNPQDLAQYSWTFVDPDTGSAVDWEDGDFSGVEFWLQTDGTEPSSSGEAVYYGIENDANDNHGALGGIGFTTGQLIVCGDPNSVITLTKFTSGATPVYLTQIRMLDMNGVDQVQVMDIHIAQLNNATDQEFLRATQSAGNQVHAANPDYKIKGYFSGNSNTKAYYRLVKKLTIPTP